MTLITKNFLFNDNKRNKLFSFTVCKQMGNGFFVHDSKLSPFVNTLKTGTKKNVLRLQDVFMIYNLPNYLRFDTVLVCSSFLVSGAGAGAGSVFVSPDF